MIFKFFSKKQPTSEESTDIFLYNTITSKTERFVPRTPGKVSLYSCGPTVYDHAHIGNLRSFLLPDLLRRLFTHDGYTVKNAINFTDFGHLSDDADVGEDKMVKALKRHQKPITLTAMRDVARIYIDSFKKDYTAMGYCEPTNWTTASAYVYAQIQLIKTLLEKGYAYETSDGVYFDVETFPNYGAIGNIDIGKIKEGTRIEANPNKHHPADFALWKKSLLGWESDWGTGFPGWHIECTAMIFDTLGKQIDIHTGGEDLKFTHHNAEIAQAEAITHKPFVHYWMHGAHLSVDGTKLAKSSGNGITLETLRKKGYSPFDLRYLFLTSHYRSPMNFTWDALNGAKIARAKILKHLHPDNTGVVHAETFSKILNTLRDDLNTAKAVAALWSMTHEENISDEDMSATIRAADTLLGLGISEKTEKKELSPVEFPKEIIELIDARKKAREDKDWNKADYLRDELTKKGYTVIDTEDGQKLQKI